MPYYSGYGYADAEVDVYAPRVYGRGYGRGYARYWGRAPRIAPLLILPSPRRLRD